MVAGLFDRAKAMEPDDEGLRELATEIELNLSVHLSIEERILYGELRRRAEDSEELVDVFEGFTEHAAAKNLIQMLQSGRKADEQFKAELQVLGENVQHHVREEESTIFSLAKELMSSEELEERGEAWEKAKKRAMTQRSSGGRKTGSRKKASGKKSAPRSKKTTGRKKRR